MKKLLIFGYGGFVGPYLAKEFVQDNYQIFGSDIVKPAHLDSGVEFFECDILSFDKVNKLIKSVKPDVIINLAAISSVGLSWKIPQTTINVNVTGSLNILEASKDLEVKPRIMFIGSSEEYKISDKPISESFELDANNPYGISKLTQERFAQIYRERYDMKIFCVRAFNHTGVGQKDSFVLASFCKQVADIEKSGQDGEIYVGNLEVSRDFSDVRDIVKAYKMVIDSDDDSIIYNIGSGNAYSLKELLSTIISFSSKKIAIVIDKNKYRPVDNKMICCDNSLIKQRIGWAPHYSIKETLKTMFEYYLSLK